MKIETTIRRMMREYPSIFPYRINVLEHLFCCYGTGMGWENGQIVDEMPRRRRRDGGPLYDVEANVVEEVKRYSGRDTKYWENLYREFYTEQNAKMLEVLNNLDERRLDRTIKKKSFYPMSGPAYGMTFSPLLSVPEDVQDDWLIGAIEMCLNILEQDPKFVDFGGRKNAKNIKLTRPVYARLHKMAITRGLNLGVIDFGKGWTIDQHLRRSRTRK